MKNSYALTGLALAAAISGCQQKTDAAPSAIAPVSDAAVTRILALPMMARCGSENPNLPAPTKTEVIDLGGKAFAVLADCAYASDAPLKSLYVQGADGVLKHQALIFYNGPEYTDGYDWEPAKTSAVTWDSAAKTFVLVDTITSDDDSSPQTRTMRWRWDGAKLAMVEASRITRATPDAELTGLVTGFPKTPAIPDPTPAAEPV